MIKNNWNQSDLTFIRNISPLRVGELVLSHPDPLLHARGNGLTCVGVERRKPTQTGKQRRRQSHFIVQSNNQAVTGQVLIINSHSVANKGILTAVLLMASRDLVCQCIFRLCCLDLF